MDELARITETRLPCVSGSHFSPDGPVSGAGRTSTRARGRPPPPLPHLRPTELAGLGLVEPADLFAAGLQPAAGADGVVPVGQREPVAVLAHRLRRQHAELGDRDDDLAEKVVGHALGRPVPDGHVQLAPEKDEKRRGDYG